MAEGGRAAAFLDRDGTIIAEADYLADPEEVRLIPGAAAAIRSLRAAGLAVVVVTNQSGIAKGLYAEEDYRAVAHRLDAVLAAENALPDRTYYCPHHPEVSGPCDCRKPDLGMYRRAAGDLDLDLGASFFVGDKPSDVIPAEQVGGMGILVRTGHGKASERRIATGVEVVDDLAGAARWILERHSI